MHNKDCRLIKLNYDRGMHMAKAMRLVEPIDLTLTPMLIDIKDYNENVLCW